MTDYVQPDSTIILYTNVELDNTYNHTFYFGSPTERENMFNPDSSASYKQHALVKLTNQMYKVAKDTNTIRVYTDKMTFSWLGMTATYYDVNYMRFKNTSYEDKWFYAFITKSEYLNEHVCELTYELDVMTTFFFDYELDPCYVEREHVLRDTIEYRRVPESLEFGQYITRDESDGDLLDKSNGLKGWSLVLVVTQGLNSGGGVRSDVVFQRYDGLPTSFIEYHTFQYATWDSTNSVWTYASNSDLQTFYDTYIDPYTQTGAPEDALIGLYLVPTPLITAIIDNEYKDPNERIISRITRPTDFLYQGNSYTPFNEKVLDYPYNFVQIFDTTGNTGSFNFEDSTYGSETVELAFKMVGNISSGSPSEIVIPLKYKGSNENILESMTFSNPPSISLITDAYKEWLASNGTLTMLSGVRGAIGAGSTVGESIGGMALGGAITAAKGAVGLVTGVTSLSTSILTTMAKYQQAYIKPNHALNTANANTMTALMHMNFMYAIRQITPQMAKCIDDYFSMFGYACHEVKVPNRAVRHRWTYTKTIGCLITPRNGQWSDYTSSGIPNIFVDKITAIYDKGITFWRTSQKGKVGKYIQTSGSDSENYPDGGVG